MWQEMELIEMSPNTVTSAIAW